VADESESQGEKQPRIIYCQKLSRELEGLDKPPFRNELGQRIYDNISKMAWEMWIEHSKMLVNEFRIDLMSEEGRNFLLKECENFFFGEGSQLPPDYVPQAQQSK
jgi:Fe-S cluster biosynthesis and repair protein YggX